MSSFREKGRVGIRTPRLRAASLLPVRTFPPSSRWSAHALPPLPEWVLSGFRAYWAAGGPYKRGSAAKALMKSHRDPPIAPKRALLNASWGALEALNRHGTLADRVAANAADFATPRRHSQLMHRPTIHPSDPRPNRGFSPAIVRAHDSPGWKLYEDTPDACLAAEHCWSAPIR